MAAAEAMRSIAHQIHTAPNDYFDQLIRSFVHKVRIGEINKANIAEANGEPVDAGQFRARIEEATARLLDSLTELLGISQAEMMRSVLINEPGFRERAALEQYYRQAQEPGNPVFFSDQFLRLWHRHHTGQLPSLQAELLKLMRPIEMRCMLLEERVQQLEALRNLVEDGVRGSKRPPTRQEIQAMSRAELNALATRFGFQIPKKSQLAIARHFALVHFGYRTTE